MQNVPRLLQLAEVLKNKSCFLFGPRQTGKTRLIEQQLKGHKTYNLLDNKIFLKLSTDLTRIRQELTATDKIIIIDEIQKLPELLDEVQLMIESHHIHFLLTGSSARALKRKGVNLLGGRARHRNLHPFTYMEIKDQFNLQKALNTGLIPSIYLSDDPHDDLLSYVGDYLREEISAEALSRNIGAFGRFLEVAGNCHGQLINYTNVSNDAQVPISTVREYFQILKDTFLGYELLAFKETTKRKPITTSKFYFFDIGVARTLQKRTHLQLGSIESGEAFESFIFQELLCFIDYKKKMDLTYWRSKSQMEVDFILDHSIAVEVKAKKNISPQDLKGLKALREEELIKEFVVVSMEDSIRQVDGITIYPWQQFLEYLWASK